MSEGVTSQVTSDEPTRVSSAAPDESVGERTKKRQKIAVACDACRARKVKCDGVRPICGVCVRRKFSGLSSHCSYGDDKEGTPLSSQWRSRASNLQLPNSSPSATAFSVLSQMSNSASFNMFEVHPGVGASHHPMSDPGIHLDHPASGLSQSGHKDVPEDKARGIDSMTGVIGDQTHGYGFFGSSSAGSFMRQIKSAIDVKVGASSRRPSFTGVRKDTLLRQPLANASNERPRDSIEYVLPSRRMADSLISVYWDQVHPLYPFLDAKIFQRSYERIWTGSSPVVDERTLMCTLNTVFALASQLSGAIKPEEREELARSYFRRAQELLQVDLWDLGSAELIQCLLLMGQYLQSTSSSHQCWMVVGHAIRIAQGLGLHLPEPESKFHHKTDRQFSRIVWHGCVLMDRVLSMTFGRPAMISKSQVDAVPLPETDDAEGSSAVESESLSNYQPSRMAFFVESLRLYDIMDDILSELYINAENTTVQDRHGVAVEQLDYDAIDLMTMMKLDQALMLWGRSLPPHLRLSSIESMRNTTFQMQSNVCRARFLHARILLFRPALSRFCHLGTSPHALDTAIDESLSYRMITQCSSLCVRAAHDVIQVIHSNLNKDDLTGPLPAWWYSILYVYTAATVLLAAQLQIMPSTGISNYSVSKSWDHAIQVLKAFERVGQSAQRCLAALELLSAKVSKVNNDASKVVQELQTQAEFKQDTSQNIVEADFGGFLDGLDFSGVDIDLSDMSWLNILPGDLY